jgi:hypothetical protein
MTTEAVSQKKASAFRIECRSIKGTVAEGEKLELRVPISERTFSPKVTELVPAKRMVWSDGTAPMFKGSLPDFGTVFERYALDLKKEAEGRAS